MRWIALITILAGMATMQVVAAGDYVLRVERVVPPVWSLKPNEAAAVQTLEFSVQPSVPFRCELIVGNETLACCGTIETRSDDEFDLQLSPSFSRVVGADAPRTDGAGQTPAEGWNEQFELIAGLEKPSIVAPREVTRWNARARKALPVRNSRERIRISLHEASDQLTQVIQQASGEDTAPDSQARYRVRVSEMVEIDRPKRGGAPGHAQERQALCFEAGATTRSFVRAIVDRTEFVVNVRLTPEQDSLVRADIVTGILPHAASGRTSRKNGQNAVEQLSVRTSVVAFPGVPKTMGGSTHSLRLLIERAEPEDKNVP